VASTSLDGRRGGQHVHLDAALGHPARVIALMPRSSAATVNRFSPTAGTTYGSAVVTSPAGRRRPSAAAQHPLSSEPASVSAR
jgi:hypothetical protein